jgi:hypothetical protein
MDLRRDDKRHGSRAAALAPRAASTRARRRLPSGSLPQGPATARCPSLRLPPIRLGTWSCLGRATGAADSTTNRTGEQISARGRPMASEDERERREMLRVVRDQAPGLL